MKLLFRPVLLAAGFCAFAQLALAQLSRTEAAQVVFQRSLHVDRSTNIFTTNQFDVKFVLGDSFFTPTNPASLFAGNKITPADVGKVLTSTPADPNFAAVKERITDSQNEFIQFLLTEQSTGRAEKRGWNERGFLPARPRRRSRTWRGPRSRRWHCRSTASRSRRPGPRPHRPSPTGRRCRWQ